MKNILNNNYYYNTKQILNNDTEKSFQNQFLKNLLCSKRILFLYCINLI